MKNKFALAAMLAVTTAPSVLPTAALAEGYRHYNHRTYYGRGGNYRHRCGGGNGAVGAIAGGVGGALIGSAIGGGTLGTIAGGVGGGLLGRHLDKQNTRHRRGC
jgi:hypothetical protein